MLNKLEMDNDDKLMSTLFDEVTWSGVTKSFVTSCANIKSDGWARIRNEAISFAKVNRHTAALVNLTNTPQVKKMNVQIFMRILIQRRGSVRIDQTMEYAGSRRGMNQRMRNHLPLCCCHHL